MTAYKKMKTWAAKKPSSPVAKKWIASQRGGKN